MRTKSRRNARIKTGRPISKMPEIDFDKEAIKAIKKRKNGHYRRWSKKSNKVR